MIFPQKVFAISFTDALAEDMVPTLFTWLFIIFILLEGVTLIISHVYALITKAPLVNYRLAKLIGPVILSGIVIAFLWYIVIVIIMDTIQRSGPGTMNMGLTMGEFKIIVIFLIVSIYYVLLIYKLFTTKIINFSKLLLYSIASFLPLIVVSLFLKFMVYIYYNWK